VGGQDRESGGHAPLGSWGKALSGGLGAKHPEADYTFFCENMLFCNGFKDDIAIFAFIAYNMK